jgi:amino acid transporter
MAEEVKDAGLNVPNAMVWSYVLNGILAMILLVTYLFALPNVDDALNDPTYFPFIYVFRQALPTGGVNALTIMIFILVVAANIDYNASTSRQTWSFARDKGFPFHSWIAYVHPRMHIPANAIGLTCIVTCLLALINIGSSVAFNAIISLQIVALMFSYTISITCVLYRRIKHPELLPNARWSLGRWGVPINVVGVCYSSFGEFFFHLNVADLFMFGFKGSIQVEYIVAEPGISSPLHFRLSSLVLSMATASLASTISFRPPPPPPPPLLDPL